MSEKKYIIKDGELVIKKPIDQSEVPSPPQINPTSTSNYFRMFLAIIFFIALVTVFVLPQTREALANTSWTITEWDNVREYNRTEEKIVITNALGLGETLAEYKLISHTEQCFHCESVIEAKIYNEQDLIRVLKAYDKNNNEVVLRDTLVSIEQTEYYFVEVPNTKEVCVWNDNRTGQVCNDEVINTFSQERNRTVYRPFVLGTKLQPGTYKIKIEGNLKRGESLDWVIEDEGNGESLTEFAWFNNDWLRRINITMDWNTTKNQEPMYLNLTGLTLATNNCSEVVITDDSDNQIARKIIENNLQDVGDGSESCEVLFPVNHTTANLSYYAYFDNAAASEVWEQDVVLWDGNFNFYDGDENDIDPQATTITILENEKLQIADITGFDITEFERINGTAVSTTIELMINCSQTVTTSSVMIEIFDETNRFQSALWNISSAGMSAGIAGAGEINAVPLDMKFTPEILRYTHDTTGSFRVGMWARPYVNKDNKGMDVERTTTTTQLLGNPAVTWIRGANMPGNAICNINYIAKSDGFVEPPVSVTQGEIELFAVDPVVELQSPNNNSFTFSEQTNFTYNVSDSDGTITNCSLFLEKGGIWETNLTDSTITEIVNQTFNVTMAIENVNWTVGCYDDGNNQANSSIFNFSRLAAEPNIELKNPANNSFLETKFVNFTYNVTIDLETIDSCSLWINESHEFVLNQTDSSITEGINQTFNLTLNSSHELFWKVECKSTPSSFNKNSSIRTFFYNTNVTAPTSATPINESITLINSINLSADGAIDADGDEINYEFWTGITVSGLAIAQNSTLKTHNFSTLSTPARYYWDVRTNDGISHSDFLGIRTLTYPIITPNCTAINDTAAYMINISFADENTTKIQDVTFTNDLSIWGTDRQLNITIDTNEVVENEYKYCISPVNATVNVDSTITYVKSGYELRNFFFEQVALRGDSRNHTLYLLATSEGIFVTFQVVSAGTQPLAGVQFTANKTIGGVPTTVSSQLTDAAGAVVAFLDPNTQHTFQFELVGFPILVTSFVPSQSFFTITLGGITDTNETTFMTGIGFTTNPLIATLTNDTNYTFSFNITSTSFVLEEAGFTLVNSSSDEIGSATCSIGTGCNASTNINIFNNTEIIMNYFWTIDGNVSRGSRVWNIQTIYQGDYSIAKLFLDDLGKLGRGFSNFTKSIISFIIILTVLSVAIVRFNINSYSTTAVLFLIFALTALLDIVNFLPPITGAVDHFIPLMMGVISIGYFIFEFKR